MERSASAGDSPGATPVVIAGLWLSLAAVALGQEPPPVLPDAGELDRQAHDFDTQTARVQALMDGSLEPTIDPSTLFDVPLSDASAIEIETRRLQALLRAADPDSERHATSTEPADAATRDASPAPIDDADAAYRSRLALDRARLSFYELPRDRRAALLLEQEERRQAIAQTETTAEREARDTQEQRQRILESARAARAEAERLVRKEHARLLSLVSRVSRVRETFESDREDLTARRATAFGWRRRVENAKTGPASDADATYDELRQYLKGARDALSSSLEDLDSADSAVPGVGRDPLQGIPIEIAQDAVRNQRRALVRLLEQTRTEEQALRIDRAAYLLDEIDLLNGERLDLLEYLSSEERDAITGFTLAGLDQARSEARQLSLIVRYHLHVAAAFLGLAKKNGRPSVSIWSSAAFLVSWLLTILVFSWWRRRSRAVLRFRSSRLRRASVCTYSHSR